MLGAKNNKNSRSPIAFSRLMMVESQHPTSPIGGWNLIFNIQTVFPVNPPCCCRPVSWCFICEFGHAMLPVGLNVGRHLFLSLSVSHLTQRWSSLIPPTRLTMPGNALNLLEESVCLSVPSAGSSLGERKRRLCLIDRLQGSLLNSVQSQRGDSNLNIQGYRVTRGSVSRTPRVQIPPLLNLL